MSRLDNFKGRIHLLSNADRIKGGSVSSLRKSQANAFKRLRTGKHSNFNYPILSCVDCPYIFECQKKNGHYCVYLVKDFSKDKDFRKKIFTNIFRKETTDDLKFVISLYSLRQMYIIYLKKYFR